MCYVHLNRDQMQGRPLLTTEQWIDIMDHAIDAGMMYADLTGGECLSYPGLREIYLHLRSRGICVVILTNGQLLTEELADFFAPQGSQLIDGGCVKEIIHNELSNELPIRSKGNHSNRVIVSEASNSRGLEPCVKRRSFVSLKEEFEQIRGGGNNGRHGSKVKREQRAITFA